MNKQMRAFKEWLERKKLSADELCAHAYDKSAHDDEMLKAASAEAGRHLAFREVLEYLESKKWLSE